MKVLFILNRSFNYSFAIKACILFLLCMTSIGCNQSGKEANMRSNLSAEEILGNPDYQAISFGGYRQKSRDIQPSIEELKEDLKLIYALGIRIIRTYNTKLAHASNVIKAINELKSENEDFEMYVMVGAWISCKGAFTEAPDHNFEDEEENKGEIQRAVALANEFPDIVKVIAVGNEAMVKWATSYFVQPGVILKWVNYLQDLKKSGSLPENLWITSSDNFASWGGGDAEYHVEDLNDLIKAVDFISLHTYPMHDTHYNPSFWGVDSSESNLPKLDKIEKAMLRSRDYAVNQYNNTKSYMESLGVSKPMHIGETGWASYSNGYYGNKGSKATDEYKSALYYQLIREWTDKNNISCFYFEAFDEPWKDSRNPGGSENHFGLFTVDGHAKYALWNAVEEGIFEGLGRNGSQVKKTFNGDLDSLLNSVAEPPIMPYDPNKKD